MAASRAAMQTRWAAGRAYAAAWRSAVRVLERFAPNSAREERRRPRLPSEPFARKYGMGLGRPIDRVYIEDFLARHGDDIRGNVLEILDPTYARRFGGGRVGQIDVLDASDGATEATIRGNLETADGLPAGVYDCFICTQTLSLIADVRAALRNSRDLLVPGGVLLATVPGISQQADPVHEEFPDYWRFTKLSLGRLLEEAFGPGAAEVEAHGTVAASAAFLYGLPAEEIDRRLLGPHDPDYEMVVCGRAVKRA
jgi:SAM-dependent methyltransferase